MVLQFIVAPILLSLVSLRLIHIMMPVIHITAITAAIVEPSVFTVRLAFGRFKAFSIIRSSVPPRKSCMCRCHITSVIAPRRSSTCSATGPAKGRHRWSSSRCSASAS
ncbi:MAG: hypothetical protein U5O39_04805 [Gammaproteobacteria bacterium]|nr:hypothetical protein [Gammaproteobacteria bacterium]